MSGKLTSNSSIVIGNDNDHMRFLLHMILDALGTRNARAVENRVMAPNRGLVNLRDLVLSDTIMMTIGRLQISRVLCDY